MLIKPDKFDEVDIQLNEEFTISKEDLKEFQQALEQLIEEFKV